MEVVNAPTVDPNAVEETQSVDPDSKYGKYGQTTEVYEGPPLEIPSLVDVIKKKKEAKEAKENSAQTAQEAKQEQSATLDSDEMEYFQDRNEIEARGNVVIKTTDGTTLEADKAIYNRDTNIIRLFDNVVLNKNDAVLEGDFMSIDLNEENVLMNEPTGKINTLTVKAQEGWAYANELQMVNGQAKFAKQFEMMLRSKGFGYFDETIVDYSLATDDLKKKRSEPLKIKTNEIVIESKKEHDVVTLKGAEVYYKKFKVAKFDSAEIISDKSQSVIETNLPEIGMVKDFGTYIGWGYTTEMPFGGTLKVMPALVYKSGAGLGIVGRYRSKRSLLEAAWGTSNEDVILRGEYNITPNLMVSYGRHAYFDEWFMGARKPGYIAQIQHHKSYKVPDLNSTYTQRFTAGYVTDYGTEEEDNRNGSMRLRWQGELQKLFVEKRNEEQDMLFRLTGYAQAGATVYGTGDVTGVMRFGPMLHTRIKNWGSRISYGVAGIHGVSPYAFDRYIYGKQYIGIDENLRLGRFLAVGYQGNISILRDNPDKDLLTENKFYVIAGPEDFKISFAYDTYRERAFLDFMFIVGKDNSDIKYNKLTVKNPDKAGKKTSLFENLKYYKVKVPESL